jgi:hypothetical protein
MAEDGYQADSRRLGEGREAACELRRSGSRGFCEIKGEDHSYFDKLSHEVGLI